MSDNFKKLTDGKTYKVYEDDGDWFQRWVTGIRYKVVDPHGNHVAFARSLRAARRAIRNHQRRPPAGHWWDQPIVEEVGDAAS